MIMQVRDIGREAQDRDCHTESNMFTVSRLHQRIDSQGELTTADGAGVIHSKNDD